MKTAHRRGGLLAAAAATASLVLAACGGSSTPHVASLGGGGTGRSASTTTTLPKGNPTQLLDEWAACMRHHGDPGQADPTVDANGVIHITVPAGAGGSAGAGGVAAFAAASKGRHSACGSYLTAASTALRGGHPFQKPDPAKLEKYAQCMRANGIPDFPDPTGSGLSLHIHPGSDLNPRNPAFQDASKLCAKKTGVPGFGGTPPRGAIQVTSNGPEGGASGRGPAGKATIIGG